MEIINAFAIIAIVVFLSGLIAFIGDKIGMKMGKKRVSLFGLRPRYSSIIITVVTGILIAVLSITILLGVYSELRNALFNINDVLNRLENLNQQLEKRDQSLAAKNKELEARDQKLADLQAQIEAREDKIAAKEEEIETKEAEIKAKDQELLAVEKELAKLTKNRDQLEKRIENLSSQRQDLENQVSELEGQIADLEADYDDLRKVAEQLRAGVIYYMDEDIVYQKGDVIYSDVLEGGRGEQKTISALNQYLQRANKVALEQEIKVNEETGMALRLQTEDILNAARIIYNMDAGSRTIVSLVARVNVPQNDWLYANFQLYEDFIVFKKGSLISSQIISPDQSSEEIENELEELLESVNVKAINQGILPDNSGQVGSLNFSQFYELVNQVRSSPTAIKVKIYAKTNIWRQDRLSDNLSFELEEFSLEEN